MFGVGYGFLEKEGVLDEVFGPMQEDDEEEHGERQREARVVLLFFVGMRVNMRETRAERFLLRGTFESLRT